MGFHPMMGFHPNHFDSRVPIRPTARTPSPPPAGRDPCITTSETHDEYRIALNPPDYDHTLQDSRAYLDGQELVIETKVASTRGGIYNYRTRDRTGIYSHPSRHSLVGVVPPGRLLRGGAPSHNGWIALDDDESWMVDDGSLVLVGQPSSDHSHRFVKRVRLPPDAALHRATTEPSRQGQGGGLRITVPRTRKVAPTPRQVPVNVKRAAPPAQKQQPSVKQGSAANVPAPPPAPTSGNEYKQRHKRQAAERRAEAMHDALLAKDEAGPVLSEVAASERHVQSPSEQVEEWLALASGGFAKSDGLGGEVVVMDVAPEVEASLSEDEGLAYYGF